MLYFSFFPNIEVTGIYDIIYIHPFLYILLFLNILIKYSNLTLLRSHPTYKTTTPHQQTIFNVSNLTLKCVLQIKISKRK